MKTLFQLFSLLTLLIIYNANPSFAQNHKDIETIRVKEKRGNTYELLNNLSTLTGYMFIYDSRVVDNKKRGKIDSGDYTLEEAIKQITGNDSLSIKKEGSYILIYTPEEKKEEVIFSGEKYIRIEGRVTDRHNGDPVVFATVNPQGSSFGTITNQEGVFRLTLPDSLSERAIIFSSMGYEQRRVSLKLLTEGNVTIEMMQSVIPLQEIIIRVVDPKSVLMDALRKKSNNYSPNPVNITSFYREGIEYKENLNLSEAVLKIFKTGFSPSFSADQVKLLKMRKLTNMDGRDTLIAKLRSSINAILLLDIMKYPPDFLQYSGMEFYNFTHTDITEIDGRRVYVFSFIQKEEILDALYKGELYIDSENHALVKAVFEVNPNHIRKFADNLIVKRSKSHEIVPTKASYEVSYKQFNNFYHINHIRGDLNFKVRKRGRLFTSPLHLWFEMANCRTDTENIEKFLSDERLSRRDVFSDIEYTYDPNFWEHFNIIMPEEKIKEIVRDYNFK